MALCVSALISGVATVITCIARHKALSRLAGAAVKQMAAHDGRDVHVSAHPAAQTPIDSGVCESFERLVRPDSIYFTEGRCENVMRPPFSL